MSSPPETDKSEGVDPASDFHIRLAEDRCQRLLEWLQEQQAKLFPTDAPRLLLNVCDQAAEQMLSRLERVREMAARHPSSPRDYVQNETGAIHDFINGLEDDFLPDLVGAEVPTTTGAIPQLLQRLATSLVGNCSLLVRTLPEFNYQSGVLTPKLNLLFDAARCGGLLKGFPEHFCVIYISSFTPNAILTHTLVGHEMGHIVYEVRDLDARLATDLAETPSGLGSDPAAMAFFKQRIAEWRMEFTCDLLALCLLGPAYVYALTGFLTATGGTAALDAASTHPSPRMRITPMLDAIEGKFGVLGYEPGSVPLTKRLREFLGPVSPATTGSLDEVAYEALQRDFRDMLTVASAAVGGQVYTLDNYRKDVDDLARRFNMAVPPNEYSDTREPPSFQSILNASWEFYINEPELMPLGRDVEPERRKERFYGLVAWALEAAELTQSWQHIRDRQQE